MDAKSNKLKPQGDSAARHKWIEDAAVTLGKDWAQPFLDKHGPFPGGALSKDRKLVQTTRLLKCECGECGYVARVTKKWVTQAGTPVCPMDEVAMTCDNGSEEE